MTTNDLPGAVKDMRSSFQGFYEFVRMAMESLYARNAELYKELREAENKIISLETLLHEKGQ